MSFLNAKTFGINLAVTAGVAILLGALGYLSGYLSGRIAMPIVSYFVMACAACILVFAPRLLR